MVDIPPEMKWFAKLYLQETKYIRPDLLDLLRSNVIENYNSLVEYGKIFEKEGNENYLDAFKRQDSSFMYGWGKYQIERAAKRNPLPKDVKVKHELNESMRGNWIDIPETNQDHVIMYIHGGAYVGGSIDALLLPYRVAKATGVRLIKVHYGLAPRHPFPEGLDYIFRAYKWLLNDFKPKNIIIGGGSAGGGLTLSLLLKLRDNSLPLPAAAFGFAPWTDLAFQGASYKVNAKNAATLHEIGLRASVKMYLPGSETDPFHPYVSPVYADLTGLPPLLIHVGGLEIFLSDAVQLAENARNAGVEVIYKRYEGMPHVFQMLDFSLPEVKDSSNEIRKFVQGKFNL